MLHHQVLLNPGEAPDRAKGTLNLNIGFPKGNAGGNGENPYAQERDVTPKELAALKAEIVELDIIAESFKKKDGDGDE